ncbi:MAG: hypothetical protein ACXAAM_03400, partial [Candidatus Heimdallarchaeaceae archaeon]
VLMHAPCSIIGYNDSTVLDLRNNSLEGVEVLLSYSVNATAVDFDDSMTEYDLYSKDNITALENGNYPAVVCDTFRIGENVSYIILAGEVIFSDHKFMYDQYTEAGVYNGGIHYGQMFVNNLINYFLANSTGIPIIKEFSVFCTIIQFAFIPAVCCIVLIVQKRRRSHR